MAPHYAPWLQQGIDEYRKEAGNAEQSALDSFICSPEAAQAFAAMEALGQEGAASELRVVEYLLPGVLDRRGNGKTAQQLLESIKEDTFGDDAEYQVVLEQELNADKRQAALLKQGMDATDFLRRIVRETSGRANPTVAYKVLQRMLGQVKQQDEAAKALHRRLELAKRQQITSSSLPVFRVVNLSPEHKAKACKAQEFLELLPQVQDQLDEHKGKLYPTGLEEIVQGVTRPLSLVQDTVQKAEQAALDVGDGAWPLAVFYNKDIDGTLRDLRRHHRDLLESVLKAVLLLKGWFEPSLALGSLKARVHNHGGVTMWPLIDKVEAIYNEGRIHNASHTREPGVDYDDIGLYVHEWPLLHNLLQDYEQLTDEYPRRKLPQVCFMLQPLKYWHPDRDQKPWAKVDASTDFPAADEASELHRKLQRRRDRLALAIESGSGLDGHERILHLCIRYHNTLEKAGRLLNWLSSATSTFNWQAKEGTKDSADSFDFELCNVLYTAAAALSNWAVCSLGNRDHDFSTSTQIKKASEMFEDAAAVLELAASKSIKASAAERIRALKVLMEVQSRELLHHTEAVDGNFPDKMCILALQVSQHYYKLNNDEALSDYFGPGWKAYADFKCCLHEVHCLYCAASSLQREKLSNRVVSDSDARSKAGAGKTPIEFRLALCLAASCLEEAALSAENLRKMMPESTFVEAAKTDQSLTRLMVNIKVAHLETKKASTLANVEISDKWLRKHAKPHVVADLVSETACKVYKQPAFYPSKPQSVLRQYEQCQIDDAIRCCRLGCSDLEEMHEVSAQHEIACYQGRARLATIEQQNVESSNAGYLASFLQNWWSRRVGRLESKVERSVFASKLAEWFLEQERNDVDADLKAYHDKLVKDGFGAELDAVMGGTATGQEHLTFLHAVVMPLIDQENSGSVCRPKLHRFQLLGEEYFALERLPPPCTWPELLDAVFLKFDRNMLKQPEGADWLCQQVTSAFQEVHAVIKSYNTHHLLKDYVADTRIWLFDDVNTWLESTLGPAGHASQQSRMFVLLADPGMGKSTFSAKVECKLTAYAHRHKKLVQVCHFFKVAGSRSQGKLMVLCFALQLAQKLPGMAEQLQPVVNDNGSGAALSMQEFFERYLLQPLWSLGCISSEGQCQHVVVMLLDALDEAADGPHGWEAVFGLIAHEFVRLPPWVKVIVTGRTHMKKAFAAWIPELKEVASTDANNLADLRTVLNKRLSEEQRVADADISAAIDILVQKSGGQFIYSKYCMHELRKKHSLWTLEELQRLPSGLYGMFHHVFDVIYGALQNERRHLLEILEQSVLPILVAARAPLTTSQIAKVSRAATPQVEYLLSLLANLFYVEPQNTDGDAYVHPYHKSVLDWLVEQRQNAFAVDATRGHDIIGLSCYNSIMASVPEAMERLKPGEASKAAALAGKELRKSGSNTVLLYSLRHGLSHLCLAGRVQRAEELALQFTEFWAKGFAAGCGPDVVKELMVFGSRISSPIIQDVLRWQRTCSPFLTKYPWAALQLATDAPSQTIVARHANELSSQPEANLLNKQEKWSACLFTLEGHEGGVNSVAVGPDIVLSGSDDGTLRVWDLMIGECKYTLKGHTGIVRGVAISADGSLGVSAAEDETIRLWDLKAGSCAATLTGHSRWVNGVALGADDQLCASCSADNTIRIWDLRDKSCKEVIYGIPKDDERLKWRHNNWIQSVALSADGCICAYGSTDDALRVSDRGASQKETALTGHSHWVECVALSGDYTCVSGSFDSTLRLWDLKMRRCTRVLAGHTMGVTSVAISADNKTCISGSRDKSIRIWDMDSGSCGLALLGHSSGVTSVAVSSDSSICVSGSRDNTLRVWDLKNGTAKAGYNGHADEVLCTAISADGKICVSGSKDATIKVWDLTEGTCTGTLDAHTYAVDCVDISADGCFCVSSDSEKGADDNSIRVWDLRSGSCPMVLTGHMLNVELIAMNTDGSICISSSADNTVRRWDVKSGKELDSFYVGSPEGRQLRELAREWHGSSTMSTAPGGLVLWAGSDMVTIHWMESNADGAGTTCECISYLMPPMHVKEGPFYEACSHTISFFDGASHQLMRYRPRRGSPMVSV